MIDMVEKAKYLIAKGKILNDPELIQMGVDLLEPYLPANPYDPPESIPELENNLPSISGEAPEPKGPEYVCGNCGYTIPVDKPDRKRCPECKKHQLKLVSYEQILPSKPKRPDPEFLLSALEDQQAGRVPSENDMDQFRRQVRATGQDRVHYDENGNPDGVIRRREQVDPNTIHNVWKDDGEEAQDQANELLKKFTKVSPRTRTPVNYVEVECEICHKIEKLHPIHAGGRGRHICSKCIKRRSGR
jgi:predicted Zn-ribbon and HTH transcriptional regulator